MKKTVLSLGLSLFATAASAQADLVKISAIQGNPLTYTTTAYGDTDASPILGATVTVQAVVTGDFQYFDSDVTKSLGGFYIQEEWFDEDGNPESSEGVYVYDGSNTVDVEIGDLVEIEAVVAQYYGETELKDISSISILAKDQLSLVEPGVIRLENNTSVTVNQDGDYQADLESYEGMLVTFPESLSIMELRLLERFNEIQLVAGPRPVQYAQIHSPDTEGLDAHLKTVGARTIKYDDGLNWQYRGVELLEGLAGFKESSAVRMGDTITGLTGVLDYKWSGNGSSGATWRVRSTTDDANVFTSSLKGDSPNPRQSSPDKLKGDVIVASTNLFNFFLTLDGETAAGHSPRGADNAEEFERQMAKIVNGLSALNADIIGIIEIENDFDPVNDNSTAIEVLVNKLNEKTDDKLWDYVYPGSQFVDTDAIATALIYNKNKVAIAEGTQVLQFTDELAAQLETFKDWDFEANPIYDQVPSNHHPLVVSFEHLTSGEEFTVVVNHLKAKSKSGMSDPTSGNYDHKDGASYWNKMRLDGVTALSEWLKTKPTGVDSSNVILLGDFNAYYNEDPIQYLKHNSFYHPLGRDAYSYSYDGMVGSLDHIMVSKSLRRKVRSATTWNINSDEATVLNYNIYSNRDLNYFDSAGAARFSDHDPTLIGLDFGRKHKGKKRSKKARHKHR